MIAQAGTRNIALLLGVLAVAACGSQPAVVAPSSPTAQTPVAHSPQRQTPGDRAAAAALQQLGAPYRYGGNSPRGFDCSGLVQFAYNAAGVAVPRTTGQLWSAARPVNHAQLQPGDLLFFEIEGKMSHVGMYLGDRRFVHAPQSGRTVSIASLDAPFYRRALLRAGRVY